MSSETEEYPQQDTEEKQCPLSYNKGIAIWYEKNVQEIQHRNINKYVFVFEVCSIIWLKYCLTQPSIYLDTL
jgi:hypothetical protein